ncbi:3'-5' exonuclease [Pseudoalteromonas pernae]|uniref:3'-5' exonuclease n=1 Tax=Pseudoalteromonas pernae TaxID=3118054 RepID=UPI003242085E
MFVKQPLIDWQSRYEELACRAAHPLINEFYQAGIVAMDTPISDVEFVAMDFETTGLNSDQDDIVSIGLVPFNWQRIFCNKSKYWILKPAQNLAEESIVIHGITHSEIENAPDLSALIEQLFMKLRGKVVVVHYQAIERPFLANALLKRIGEGVQFAVVDTMELERRALSMRRGFIGKLFGEKLGSLRLADCRTRYNLPNYAAHNAMTDALATAELLQAQLSYHYRSDTPIHQLWI